MTLKTLKDFDNRMYRSKSCQLLFRRLKDEAEKWVKMLQDRIIKGIAYDYDKSKIEWKAQIDILRIVFNITEEDLK